jgi:hypothetical protein
MLMRSGPSRSRAHSGLCTLPSFTARAVWRRSHIHSTVTCLTWLVLDLGARSKVLGLRAIVNHHRHTSQAWLTTTTIHTDTTQTLMVSTHYKLTSSSVRVTLKLLDLNISVRNRHNWYIRIGSKDKNKNRKDKNVRIKWLKIRDKNDRGWKRLSNGRWMEDQDKKTP